MPDIPTGLVTPVVDVTAIVVCYGPPEQLRDCIDALILRGSVRPSALILVDNNPVERRVRPSDLPRSFAAAGGTILVPESNLGFGRAVNRALPSVSTGHLLVLNPDLALEREALDRLLETLRRSERVGAVGPLLNALGEGDPPVAAERYPTLLGDLLGLAGLRRRGRSARGGVRSRVSAPERTFLSGACFLIRRDLMERLGGFDPRFFLYYEDADLSRRLVEAGWRLLMVPEARARHVAGGSWSDPVRRQETSLRGGLLYHGKYDGLTGALLYRLGLLMLYLPRLLLGFGSYLPGMPRASWTPGQRFRMMRATIRLALQSRSGPAFTPRDRPGGPA